MATRCFSPPESSDGRWFMRGSRPTSVSASMARCAGGAPAHALVAQHGRHLLQGGQRREQVEALEDEAAVVEPEAVDLAGAAAPEVCAKGRHLARVRPHQPRERRDQRRLARARRAHDHGHVAGAGVEVHRFSTSMWVRPVLKRLVRPSAEIRLTVRARGCSSQQVRRLALLQDAHRHGAGDHGQDHQHDRRRRWPGPIAAPAAGRWRRPASEISQVRAQWPPGPATPDPERQLHHDQPQRAHGDAQRPQRGELADVGEDRPAQGLRGDADADPDGQKTKNTSRMPMICSDSSAASSLALLSCRLVSAW